MLRSWPGKTPAMAKPTKLSAGIVQTTRRWKKLAKGLPLPADSLSGTRRAMAREESEPVGINFRSRAGLDELRNDLQSCNDSLALGSESFVAVEKEITRVDKVLEMAATLFI